MTTLTDKSPIKGKEKPKISFSPNSTISHSYRIARKLDFDEQRAVEGFAFDPQTWQQTVQSFQVNSQLLLAPSRANSNARRPSSSVESRTSISTGWRSEYPPSIAGGEKEDSKRKSSIIKSSSKSRRKSSTVNEIIESRRSSSVYSTVAASKRPVSAIALSRTEFSGVKTIAKNITKSRVASAHARVFSNEEKHEDIVDYIIANDIDKYIEGKLDLQSKIPIAPPLPIVNEDSLYAKEIKESLFDSFVDLDTRFRPNLPEWLEVTEKQLLERKRSRIIGSKKSKRQKSLECRPLCLNNPQFFRMNLKLVPLELFDDDESEAVNPLKLLQESKKEGKPGIYAYSRYFDHRQPAGSWEWAPCLVEDFDPFTCYYRIRWLNSSSTKQVRRLNLFFDHDNRDMFYKRMELASDKREYYVKEFQRLLEIDQTQDKNCHLLKRGVIRNILIFSRIALNEKTVPILKPLIYECQVLYLFAMKQCIPNTNNKKNDSYDVNRGFANMASKSLSCEDEVQKEHLVDNFIKISKKISSHMFMANIDVQRSTIKIIEAFESIFKDETFFTGLTEFPYSFYYLEERCTLHAQSIQTRLKITWQRIIMDIIQVSLATSFDLRPKSIKAYENSRLKNFLMLVNMIMEEQLRSFIMKSLHHLLSFFKIQVQSEVIEAEPNSGEKLTRKLTMITPKMKGQSIPVLFTVSIGLAASKDVWTVQEDEATPDRRKVIVLKPTLVSLEHSLISFLRVPITYLHNCIPRLDWQFLNGLDLEESYLLPSCYEEISEFVQLGSKSVMEILQESYKEVKALVAKYKSFEYIFQDDVVHNPSFSVDTPLDVLENNLLVYANAVNDLLCISGESVCIPPIIVDCYRIKTALLQQARQGLEVFRSLLETKLMAVCFVINDTFGLISSNLNMIPRDIAGWKQLKSYVDLADGKIIDVKNKLQEATKMSKIFEKANVNISDDLNVRYWTAYQWPQKISLTLKFANQSLLNFKNELIQKIKIEKEFIHSSLEAYMNELQSLSQMDNEKSTTTAFQIIKSMRERFTKVMFVAESIHEREFNLDGEEGEILPKIIAFENQFLPYETIWSLSFDIDSLVPKWMDTLLGFLDITNVCKTVDSWKQRLNVDLNVFINPPTALLSILKSKVLNFSRHVPLIMALRNPKLTPSHWLILHKQVGISLEMLQTHTLSNLIDMNVDLMLVSIIDISDSATREARVDAALEDLMNQLRKSKLDLVPHLTEQIYRINNNFELKKIIESQFEECRTILCDKKFILTNKAQSKVIAWMNKIVELQTAIFSMDEIIGYFSTLYGLRFCNQSLWNGFEEQFESWCNQYVLVEKLVKSTSDIIQRNPRLSNIVLRLEFFNSLEEGCVKARNMLGQMEAIFNAARARCHRLYLIDDSQIISLIGKVALYDPTALNSVFPGMTKLVLNSLSNENEIFLRECQISAELSYLFPYRKKTLELQNRKQISFVCSGSEEKLFIRLPLIYSQDCIDMIDRIAYAIDDNIRYGVRQTIIIFRQKGFAIDWMQNLDYHSILVSFGITRTGLIDELVPSRNSTHMKEAKRRLQKEMDAATKMIRSNYRKKLDWLISLYQCEIGELDNVISVVGSKQIIEGEYRATFKYYEEENNIIVRQGVNTFTYGYDFCGDFPRLLLSATCRQTIEQVMEAIHEQSLIVLHGSQDMGKTELLKEFASMIGRTILELRFFAQTNIPSIIGFLKASLSLNQWILFTDIESISSQKLTELSFSLNQLHRSCVIANMTNAKSINWLGEDYKNKKYHAIFLVFEDYETRESAVVGHSIRHYFRPITMISPSPLIMAEMILCSFTKSASVIARKISCCIRICSQYINFVGVRSPCLQIVQQFLSLKANNTENLEDIKIAYISCLTILKSRAHDANLVSLIVRDAFLKDEIDKNNNNQSFEMLKLEIADSIKKTPIVFVNGGQFSGKTGLIKAAISELQVTQIFSFSITAFNQMKNGIRFAGNSVFHLFGPSNDFGSVLDILSQIISVDSSIRFIIESVDIHRKLSGKKAHVVAVPSSILSENVLLDDTIKKINKWVSNQKLKWIRETIESRYRQFIGIYGKLKITTKTNWIVILHQSVRLLRALFEQVSLKGELEKLTPEEQFTCFGSFILFSMIWSFGARLDANKRMSMDKYIRVLPDNEIPKVFTVFDYYYDTRIMAWVLWENEADKVLNDGGTNEISRMSSMIQLAEFHGMSIVFVTPKGCPTDDIVEKAIDKSRFSLFNKIIVTELTTHDQINTNALDRMSCMSYSSRCPKHSVSQVLWISGDLQSAQDLVCNHQTYLGNRNISLERTIIFAQTSDSIPDSIYNQAFVIKLNYSRDDYLQRAVNSSVRIFFTERSAAEELEEICGKILRIYESFKTHQIAYEFDDYYRFNDEQFLQSLEFLRSLSRSLQKEAIQEWLEDFNWRIQSQLRSSAPKNLEEFSKVFEHFEFETRQRYCRITDESKTLVDYKENEEVNMAFNNEQIAEKEWIFDTINALTIPPRNCYLAFPFEDKSKKIVQVACNHSNIKTFTFAHATITSFIQSGLKEWCERSLLHRKRSALIFTQSWLRQPKSELELLYQMFLGSPGIVNLLTDKSEWIEQRVLFAQRNGLNVDDSYKVDSLMMRQIISTVSFVFLGDSQSLSDSQLESVLGRCHILRYKRPLNLSNFESADAIAVEQFMNVIFDRLSEKFHVPSITIQDMVDDIYSLNQELIRLNISDEQLYLNGIEKTEKSEQHINFLKSKLQKLQRQLNDSSILTTEKMKHIELTQENVRDADQRLQKSQANLQKALDEYQSLKLSYQRAIQSKESNVQNAKRNIEFLGPQDIALLNELIPTCKPLASMIDYLSSIVYDSNNKSILKDSNLYETIRELKMDGTIKLKTMEFKSSYFIKELSAAQLSMKSITLLSELLDSIYDYREKLIELFPKYEKLIYMEKQMNKMNTSLVEEQAKRKDYETRLSILINEVDELLKDKAELNESIIETERLYQETLINSEKLVSLLKRWKDKLSSKKNQSLCCLGNALYLATIIHIFGSLQSEERQAFRAECRQAIVDTGLILVEGNFNPKSESAKDRTNYLFHFQGFKFLTTSSMELIGSGDLPEEVLENLFILSKTRKPMVIAENHGWYEFLLKGLKIVNSVKECKVNQLLKGEISFSNDICWFIDYAELNQHSIKEIINRASIYEKLKSSILLYRPLCMINYKKTKPIPGQTLFSFLDFDTSRRLLVQILIYKHLQICCPSYIKEYHKTFQELQDIEEAIRRDEKMKLTALVDFASDDIVQISHNLAFYEETYRKRQSQAETLKKQMIALQTFVNEKLRVTFEYAAELYQVLHKMKIINSSYEISLDMFLNQFSDHMEEYHRKESEFLCVNWFLDFSKTVFNSIQLHVDRFTCDSFLLYVASCYNQLKNDESPVSLDYWEFLVFGRSNDDNSIWQEDTIPNPAASWMDKKTWNSLLCVGQLPRFAKIIAEFHKYANRATTNLEDISWEDYFYSKDAYQCQFPAKYSQLLSKVEQLIILRCLRPDSLQKAIREFVFQSIGNWYLSFQSLSDLINLANNSKPTLLVLKENDDLTLFLKRMTEKYDAGNIFINVDITSFTNQTDLLNMMTEASDKGKWLCLFSIHHNPSLIQSVAQTYLSKLRHHSRARLFMVIQYSKLERFPISFLTSCKRILIDFSLFSLPQYMMTAFELLDDQLLIPMNLTKKIMKKTVLFLLFFHVILLEIQHLPFAACQYYYEIRLSDLSMAHNRVRELMIAYSKDIEREEDLKVLHSFESLNSHAESNSSTERGEVYRIIRETMADIIDVVYSGKSLDVFDSRNIQQTIAEIVTSEWDRDSETTNTLASYLPIKKIYKYIVSDPNPDIATFTTMISALPQRIPLMWLGQSENASILAEGLFALETIRIMEIILPLRRQREVGASDIYYNGSKIIQESLAKLDFLPNNRAPEVSASELHLFVERIYKEEYEMYKECRSKIISTFEGILMKQRQFIILNEDEKIILSELCHGNVPKVWITSGFCFFGQTYHQNWFSWLANLVSRIDYFQEWNEKKVSNKDWPVIHDLSKISRVDQLFAAFLKDHSSNFKEPLEQLEFEVTFMASRQNTIPSKGYYLSGLTMRNAMWDFSRGTMRDAKIHEHYCKLPCIYILPIVSPSHVHQSFFTMHNGNPSNLNNPNSTGISNTGGAKNAVFSLRRVHTKYQLHLFAMDDVATKVNSQGWAHHAFDKNKNSVVGFDFVQMYSAPVRRVDVEIYVPSDVTPRHWLRKRAHLLYQG